MTGEGILGDLDRVVHEPARLAILAVLCGVSEADFTFLLGQTGLTKGNLSSHIARLESAGYVEVRKAFTGRVPRTTYLVTTAGWEALDGYRRDLSRVVSLLGEAAERDR